jgi:hypothetical protein
VLRRHALPGDIDAESARRLARSFLVVRLLRGAGLLLFLALAAVGVVAKGWPRGVLVAVLLALVLQAVAMLAAWRRYRRAVGG